MPAKVPTVRVTLLQPRCGQRIKIEADGSKKIVGEFAQKVGDVVDVDAADAERMVAAGQAELVDAASVR